MDSRQELRNARLRDLTENGLEEPSLPGKWQRLTLRTPPLTLRIPPACKSRAPWERKGVYYPAGANRRYRTEIRIPGWKEKAWVGQISTLGEAMLAVDLVLQFTGREHCHYDFCSDYVLRPTEHHLLPQAVGAYIKSLAPRSNGDNPPDLVTLRKEFILCLKKVVEDALYHGGQEEVEEPPVSTTASGLGSSFPDVSQALANMDAPRKPDFESFPEIEESCYKVALPEASKQFAHNLSSVSELEYLQKYQGSIEGVPD